MSEARLFSVGKIPIFLDSFKPAREKRREDTVTVINCTFRVHPFDAKLATSIDEGLDAGVRALLFKLNTVEPKAIIGDIGLNIDCPRQNMEIFASPDTDESSLMLLQVKITNTKAVEHADVSGFAFTFHGTLGPMDRDTLMQLNGWFGTQRFVTFQASEPSLDFSDENVEDDEDEDEPPMRPIFEHDEDPEPPSPGVQAAQDATNERRQEKANRYPRRNARKTAPETERQAQASEGKKRSAPKAKKAKSRSKR